MIEDIENLSQSSIAPVFPQRKQSKKTIKDSALSTYKHMLSFAEQQPQLDSRQCRVCLQGQLTSDNKLITPCNCMGSVRYIHKKCFLTWLQKKYKSKPAHERKQLIDHGIQCEICKQKIKLNLQKFHHCTSKQTLVKKISTYKLVFLLFLIAIISNIACQVFLVNYIVNHLNLQKQLLNGIMVILICCILSLTLIILIYYLFDQWMLQKSIKIVSFYKKQNHRKSRLQNMRITPAQSFQNRFV